MNWVKADEYEGKKTEVKNRLEEKRKRKGMVSIFNGISTLCRLFNDKAILLGEQ